MKARGRRPSAFIVFECLETLMKPYARVFEIASRSRLRNERKFFTCCRQVCSINIQIKKSVHQCLMLYPTQGFDII